MRRTAVVVILGLGAILAIVLAVWAPSFLGPPPVEVPRNPLDDVTFTTERSQYSIGERAVFVLVNEGDVVFSFPTWTIERSMDGEWVGVECHAESLRLRSLHPGERLAYSWTVATADPAFCGIELPAVEEGLFRGVAWLHPPQDVGEPGPLFAEFVVA